MLLFSLLSDFVFVVGKCLQTHKSLHPEYLTKTIRLSRGYYSQITTITTMVMFLYPSRMSVMAVINTINSGGSKLVPVITYSEINEKRGKGRGKERTSVFDETSHSDLSDI